jgi:hypothetical protein
MNEEQIQTVHGDAALHGITMAHENQGFRFLICRKPSTCEELQSTRIHYILLQQTNKKVLKSRNKNKVQNMKKKKKKPGEPRHI